MSTPTKADGLGTLDARIASAWAALNGARAAAWHSPNADNLLVEQMCGRVVDELLEQRYEMTSQATAQARASTTSRAKPRASRAE